MSECCTIVLGMDDALVVVEGAHKRPSKEGLAPKDAARRAMESSPGPSSYRPGVSRRSSWARQSSSQRLTGRRRQQFALTIATSPWSSLAFNALTLSQAPRLPANSYGQRMEEALATRKILRVFIVVSSGTTLSAADTGAST